MSVLLSPDGNRVALDVRDQQNDIWILDLGPKRLERVTFSPAMDRNPVWTRDGDAIVYSNSAAGNPNLYRKAANNTGEPAKLSQSANAQFAASATPDGAHIIYREDSDTQEIRLVSLVGDHRTTRSDLPGWAAWTVAALERRRNETRLVS
jgi:Tol biopolymer transport system component